MEIKADENTHLIGDGVRKKNGNVSHSLIVHIKIPKHRKKLMLTKIVVH